MKEKILSIVPEAILEEKHGIWFVSVPRTSFHDLALRLRNDEDTSFDFLVCMTGMDWGEPDTAKDTPDTPGHGQPERT